MHMVMSVYFVLTRNKGRGCAATKRGDKWSACLLHLAYCFVLSHGRDHSSNCGDDLIYGIWKIGNPK